MAREDCEIEKMLSITEEGQAVTPGAQGHTLLFHFINRHITEKNRSPYLSYSAHQSTKWQQQSPTEGQRNKCNCHFQRLLKSMKSRAKINVTCTIKLRDSKPHNRRAKGRTSVPFTVCSTWIFLCTACSSFWRILPTNTFHLLQASRFNIRSSCLVLQKSGKAALACSKWDDYQNQEHLHIGLQTVFRPTTISRGRTYRRLIWLRRHQTDVANETTHCLHDIPNRKLVLLSLQKKRSLSHLPQRTGKTLRLHWSPGLSTEACGQQHILAEITVSQASLCHYWEVIISPLFIFMGSTWVRRPSVCCLGNRSGDQNKHLLRVSTRPACLVALEA